MKAVARILGALELEPMSIRQLSRCLTLTESCVEKSMADLRQLGEIRAVAVRRGKSRPEKLWARKSQISADQARSGAR